MMTQTAHGNCCEHCNGQLASVRDLVERRAGQNYASWSWEKALRIILGEAPAEPCPLCIASEFALTPEFAALAITTLPKDVWESWCRAVDNGAHIGCDLVEESANA